MVAKPLRLSLWVYLEDPLKWGIFRFSILSLKKLFVARWEWRAIDLSKSLNHERFHIVEECYERWVTFTWQEKETISFQVTSKKKGTMNEGSEKKSMETIDTRPYWLWRIYNKKGGFKYNEIFSPFMIITKIRTIIVFVNAKDFQLKQIDVKTIFFA